MQETGGAARYTACARIAPALSAALTVNSPPAFRKTPEGPRSFRANTGADSTGETRAGGAGPSRDLGHGATDIQAVVPMAVLAQLARAHDG